MKKKKPEKKHTAMKLPESATTARTGAVVPAGGSWQGGSGKPHKTPEHLMGKARKVH